MKRTLTVVLAPWSETPLEAHQCMYRKLEVDTDGDSQLRVLAVAVENDMQLARGSYDASATVIDGHHIDDLVGKLLTYVDATYQDKEQREAHKSIVRKTAWEWFNHHRTNGEKTVKYASSKELAEQR